MSTYYRLLGKVLARDLFDGCLAEFGVREHVNPETNENHRMLTDSQNYLWVYIGDDGFVGSLTRYAPNGDPTEILNAVAKAFDVEIVSEYEPQYWGFETQEEWAACMEELGREADEGFYVNVLKYLRGEPNDISPGTNGMRMAEIARTLVEKDKSLLLPENKDRLLNNIRSVYDRDHALTVTLSSLDDDGQT